MTLAYNQDATYVVPLQVSLDVLTLRISWGLTYNMYGDKLLGLNLFPTSLYTQREQTLHIQISLLTYINPRDRLVQVRHDQLRRPA